MGLYIQPNSTISLLRNVPLDNTYEHTIYFSNATAQVDYFESKIKYTFNAQSYQRLNREYLRIQKNAEDLMDCNYLMFQNIREGHYKWFYAFITEVNYINEAVTEIRYEIDVMQSWHFNYQVEQCFVEREHSLTDNVGDNTVPEDLETGDYFSALMGDTGQFVSWDIVVCATFDEQLVNATGASYCGIYSGLHYNRFPMSVSGVPQVNNFLDRIATAEKADGIVSIFLIPSVFWKTPDTQSHISFPDSISISKSKPTNLGGYTPRNKKLLTYPYNMLYVTNYQGNSATYPFEYFSTNDCQFGLSGDYNANPTFSLRPYFYKGVTSNWDEELTMSGVAQCAYTIDAYKQWLARVASSLPLDMIANATGLVAGIYRSTSIASAMQTTKSAALVEAQKGTAVLGAVSYASRMLGAMAEHAIKPPQANGTQGSSMKIAYAQYDFHFFQKYIKPEFARIIDDYFDAYGYACHRLKVPNRSSRPYWNFCKTVGCSITGSIPTDDASKICSIYDKGITFWKSGSYIGNYSSYNNAPV